LAARLVVKYRNEAKKASWRCVAEGCNHVRQGNAQLDRILKLASTCKFLQESDHDLWQDAINKSHHGSLSAQLEGVLDEEKDEPPCKKMKGHP
jgi:hypothetical protein